MNIWYIIAPIIGILVITIVVLLAVFVPKLSKPLTPNNLPPKPQPAPPFRRKVEIPVASNNTPPPQQNQPLLDSTSPSSDPTFSCDYLTGTCMPDPNGTLHSCDECEKRTYMCDPSTWSCRDVGFLRDSASQCKRSCYPDLRIKSGPYETERSDTHANGEGAFCDQGRYRQTTGSNVQGTSVPGYEWEDVSCVGYRCCTSHFCDPSGAGEDPYSTTVCPRYATQTTCENAGNQDVPAYCEWTGSVCQAAGGTTSACAACSSDSDCPGEFGAFKCESGNCVVQGNPKCDTIHKEYRTDDVVPAHMMKACKSLFNNDRDTPLRMCRNVTDSNVCAGSYFDRSCVDRNGKVWVTERTHCGPRTAPRYPQYDDDFTEI